MLIQGRPGPAGSTRGSLVVHINTRAAREPSGWEVEHVNVLTLFERQIEPLAVQKPYFYKKLSLERACFLNLKKMHYNSQKK